jgi:RNA polymerase sigma-70 factor (ECF subfamily)
MHNVDLPAIVTHSESDPRAAMEFHTVFQFHGPYVWHTLRRLGVHPSDLEDQTHEVFLQVFHQFAEYDPTRPIRPWLFAFAFRKALKYRGRAQHRLEVMGHESEVADPHPTALDALLRKEALDLAHAALSGLELGQRAVFILHELDGCAMPEIAATLDLALNTAYSRLRLARAAFEKAARRLRLRQGEP